MRHVFLAIAVLLAGPAEAKIYKWVLPDGTVKYSDKPQEAGAKEVELPPLQIYEAPKTPAQGTRKVIRKGGTSATTYAEFTVKAPVDGETLRDNGGNVSVQLSIVPALASDHTVEILVDGQAVGSGRSTSIDLANVDRGSHTVEAVVRDAKGEELARTPPTTFNLRRATRLN